MISFRRRPRGGQERRGGLTDLTVGLLAGGAFVVALALTLLLKHKMKSVASGDKTAALSPLSRVARALGRSVSTEGDVTFTPPRPSSGPRESGVASNGSGAVQLSLETLEEVAGELINECEFLDPGVDFDVLCVCDPGGS